MPIPSPNKGQSEKDFISECMSDEAMKKEFPNNKQRFAVCNSKLKGSKKAKANEDLSWLDELNKSYIIW